MKFQAGMFLENLGVQNWKSHLVQNLELRFLLAAHMVMLVLL